MGNAEVKGVSSAAFNEAYSSLNEAQKKAVDAIEGPVMVIAGPGTGKTQILTLRIANILKETQVTPENILALTFTNSGARAMRERLRTYIHDEAYRVGIFTFHSFAEHILSHYSSYFPSHEFSEVITELETVKVLEQILEQHDFTEIVSAHDRFSSLRQIKKAIENIKQEGLRPDEFEALLPKWKKEMFEDESVFYKRPTGNYKVGDMKPTEKQKIEKRLAKAREIATVYAEYQRQLVKLNRYDFSDMILSVLQAMENNENLKLDLQEQFQYVLVDEHQDTNEGQNKLVEFLTDAEHLDGRPNLFTVGDEKQSIFRFQGASDKAFAYFKDHYKDVVVIDLEQNYRSTAPILAAAHELILNSLPNAEALKSSLKDDKPVSVAEFTDYKFELLYVIKDIKSKLDAGISPDEIAIIYRSNKHLAEIKLLLQQFSIPYHVLSRDTLLDDPSVLMFINLIRVVADPYGDHHLGKLLFADFLALDPLTVADTLRTYSGLRRNKGNEQRLIDHLKDDPAYTELISLISELKTYESNHNFTETFKQALHASGYLTRVLSSSDSRSRLRKIETLFNELRQQAERSDGYSATDFISFIDATLAYGLQIEVTAASVGKGVQCMTAHGSKGLEFEHVYLLNTTRSSWEKSRGFADISLPLLRYRGEIDDERRLFYVAITRAKTHLTITSSKQDWYGKPLEPSQFISELAETAVVQEPVESFESTASDELVRFFSTEHAQDSVFNEEYLRQRFLEENISVTALNNYINCPLKYLFRNLIRLPDVYTSALRYGDTMHKALEAFFVESAEQGKVLSREVLLGTYEKAMRSSGFFAADFDKYLLKGRQSLRMYYDYYHSQWSTNVALEEYVKRAYESGDFVVTLSGKMDKIEFLEEMGHGKVRVVDYKTGKVFSKKSTKEQKDALERQIRFYHLLLQGYKGGDIIVSEAVLDFVEPTEKGEFEQKSLSVSDEDLAVLKTEINTMVSEVIDGSFLKRGCGKKDCESCAFWSELQK